MVKHVLVVAVSLAALATTLPAQMAVGPEFQVNAPTTDARQPAVANDADGNFVVVWRSNTDGVVARRF